jgi:tetratricopeptide (TPR) repeat protein
MEDGAMQDAVKNRVFRNEHRFSRSSLSAFLRPARRIALGLVLGAAACLAACSSTPKRPAELFSSRNMAETYLELATKDTDRGSYDAALDTLDEARRAAVGADDPSLRIRTALLRGNILFYRGDLKAAEAEWQQALAEAEASGDRELAARCRIHRGWGTLMEAIARKAGPEAAQAVRDAVNRDAAQLKKDTEGIAFGHMVIALAEKELGRSKEAEAAAQKALAIHDKENYLEKAAYDWYIIASIRSVAGRYADAQKALDEAIAFDRRAENAAGLAAEWRARGDVYTRAGNAALAEEAYTRSREIYATITE